MRGPAHLTILGRYDGQRRIIGAARWPSTVSSTTAARPCGTLWKGDGILRSLQETTLTSAAGCSHPGCLLPNRRTAGREVSGRATHWEPRRPERASNHCDVAQLRRERFSLDRARSQIAAARRGGMLRALLRRPPRGGARHRVRTPLASGPAPADRRTASPTFRRTPGQPQGELSRPPAARTASARAREHTGRSVGQPGRLLVRSAGAGAGMGARW